MSFELEKIQIGNWPKIHRHQHTQRVVLRNDLGQSAVSSPVRVAFIISILLRLRGIQLIYTSLFG